ncbi:MAG TPA: YggS family pyridoxal phosphate enzyme, partial [Deltaproteobacteria bacterium]|nr:YggS family pyridoxal phosphate enzyme [Deltaproteobacteria bacterium]
PLKILFEVNLSQEATKHGSTEDALRSMIEHVSGLQHLEPVGLMTMPPPVEDPEEVRPYFIGLRGLLDTCNREFGLSMKELSMGMSQDFEVAIEEGATMVRIGTALFGERQ